MLLQEVMSRDISAVSANDYALAALRYMRSRNLDRVFVLERDRVAGVVFARDLERYSDEILTERDVREYMSTDLSVIAPDSTLEEAASVLERGRVACLAVVKNNRLLGSITADVLRNPACLRSGRLA